MRMDDIFDIKFPIEQEIKEKVIVKFSNKQGGAYNIFSYYWQCFVWAATIGYLRNEPRKLSTGIERIFSLNTMKANGGEKDAQALICMCIARSGSIDIMKNPTDAIQQISEFANGGFYHIMKLMENGENSFNDLEKVKQEIFSRNYDDNGVPQPAPQVEEYVVPEETYSRKEIEEESQTEEFISDAPTAIPRKTRRWTFKEEKDLVGYYQNGMTIEMLARLFGKDEDTIRAKLAQKGITV
jgi:hypothetical protein